MMATLHFLGGYHKKTLDVKEKKSNKEAHVLVP